MIQNQEPSVIFLIFDSEIKSKSDDDLNHLATWNAADEPLLSQFVIVRVNLK